MEMRNRFIFHESDLVAISWLNVTVDSDYEDGTFWDAITRRHDGCVQQDPVYCQEWWNRLSSERSVWFARVDSSLVLQLPYRLRIA